MSHNIEEMGYSELIQFAKKVSNSLLDISEKHELFKRIDAREIALNRDSAVCAESDISINEMEDII